MAENHEGEESDVGATGTPFDDLLDTIDDESTTAEAEEDDTTVHQGGIDELAELEDGDSVRTEPIGADADDRALISMLDQMGTRDRSARTSFDDLLTRIHDRSGATKARTAQQGLPPLDPGESAIIIGPLGTEMDDEICMSAFDHRDRHDRRYLFVSLTRRTTPRLPLFRQKMESQSEDLAHIHRGGDRSGENVRSVHVSDPGDLAHLGISISKILDDWSETDDRIEICLHSLSTLLQHADEQRVFRFLHVLLGRIDDAGATIHVHIDSGQHDPETIILFQQLFDVSARISDDGVEITP